MASIQSILNKIASMANRTGLFSIQKGEFFDTLTDITNKVKEVNDNVNSVAKSLIWQNSVANFAALATTYPTPEIGWAAMVTGEGFVYSWNGTAWKNTGLTAFPEDLATRNMIMEDTFEHFDNILTEVSIYNGYVNSLGIVTGTIDVNWFHTDLLKVKPCTLNLTSVWGSGDVINIASFYDINGAYISGITAGNNFEITEESGIALVRFSGAMDTITANLAIISGLFFKESVNRLDVLNLEIENKAEKFKDVYEYFDNILTEVSIYNGYVNSLGVVTGNTDVNWFHTDLLKVKPCTLNLNMILGQGNAVNIASFHDVNGSYLFGITDLGASVNYEITEESGICFVRFSGSSPYITNNTAIVSGLFFKSRINVIDNLDNEISKNTQDLSRLISNPIGFKYDVNHFIDYGQSLSQGDWQGEIISNNQKYNSLMFTGGIRVWENRNQAIIYDALVPAIETAFHYEDGETVIGAIYRGETPCVGISDKIVELIQSENNFDISKYQFQMLMSAPGMGGMTIEALMDKSGLYYTRLLRDVTNGKRLSTSQGKSYACLGLAFIQGESNCETNTNEITYYIMMSILFDSLNSDIKAITGQTEDVHFFLYQTWCYDFYFSGFHYPDVPLAQLRLSLEKENVHMACPIYHLPLLGDYVHLSPVGSKLLGGSIGLAYKRTIIDGQSWKPIHLTDYWVDGNNVYLKFYAPMLPLQLDIVNIPDVGIGKGFQFRNPTDRAQNSFINMITNVEVSKPDVIKITCNQNPRGKKLTYLINGTATPTNKTGMCSGNLRDSQEIQYSFKDSTGASSESVHYLYNFCPLFETII